jgi:hypothetical protein
MDVATKTEGLISELGDLVKRVANLKGQCASNQSSPVPVRLEGDAKGEVLANLTLAVRHIEDAQSRVEKAWCLMGTDQPIHQS